MKKLLLASLMIILSASLMAQNEEKTRIYILNRLLEAKVENIKYFFHKDYFVKITKKGNIETAQAINIKEISSIKIFDADLDKIYLKSKFNIIYTYNDEKVENLFKKILDKKLSQINSTGELVIDTKNNINNNKIVESFKHLVKLKGGKIIDNLFD